MNDSGWVDFHLMINRVAGAEPGRYVTVIAEAPVSRFSREWCELVIPNDDELRIGLQLRGGLQQRLRNKLFRLLFPRQSTNLELFAATCRLVQQPNQYLRLRLEVHQDLAAIPWELMACPRDYPEVADIAQARTRLLVSRFVGSGMTTPIAPSGTAGTVIVVMANPTDLPHTNNVTASLYQELNAVRNTLGDKSALKVSSVFIEERTSNTRDDLRRAIEVAEESGRPVTAIHFIGHGGMDEEGGYFCGQLGERTVDPLYGEDLHDLLEPANSIQWVILNACWTGAEPAGYPLASLASYLAVVKKVPFVIAYQKPLSDEAARTLTKDFYQMVFEKGSSVDGAIRAVRPRIRDAGLIVFESGPAASLPLFSGPPPISIPRAEAASDPDAAQPAPPPPVVRSKHVPRLEAMIPIPASQYRRGLTPAQIDTIIERTKRQGYAVDLDSVRKVLRGEKVEQVHVDAFFIDPVPVTNREFERFVLETKHRTEAERRSNPENWREYFSDEEKAEHPVVCVSYDDAEAYCLWAGKRLPTADEWKKAFRGTNGRMYPWGDDFDEDKCNTAESCSGWQTTPVRMFPQGASVYGCLDMLGNVEEWTSTDEGSKKMIFGGSWSMTCEVYGLPVVNRVASRTFYSNDLGFRCVVSDPPKP